MIVIDGDNGGGIIVDDNDVGGGGSGYDDDGGSCDDDDEYYNLETSIIHNFRKAYTTLTYLVCPLGSYSGVTSESVYLHPGGRSILSASLTSNCKRRYLSLIQL